MEEKIKLGDGLGNMKSMKKKLCFAASAGGHFEQLSMLKPLMDKYDSCVVTERTDYKRIVEGHKMYYMHQVNRKEIFMPFWMVVNSLRSLRILAVEKPDMIITTGVLAMIPLCLLGKILGKKLVYIESFAKVTSPTATGKLLYKLADRFYVQWESMKEFYPNAIYLGGIY